MKAPESMVKLIEQLRKLPGVGPKTAGRMALHILQMDPETVAGLAEAMVNAIDEAVAGILTGSPAPELLVALGGEH